MKLYRFYKNLTDEEFEFTRNSRLNISIEDKYPLYAFTNNKKYRNLFKLMRNEKLFIEMKDEVTKEEYIEFLNKHVYSELKILPYRKFTGRRTNNNEPIFTDVNILSNRNELNTIEEISENTLLLDTSSGGILNLDFNLLTYKRKIISSLDTLGFLDLWKFYVESEHKKFNLFSELNNDEVEFDYNMPDFEYDYFNLFLNVYGDTFNFDDWSKYIS